MPDSFSCQRLPQAIPRVFHWGCAISVLKLQFEPGAKFTTQSCRVSHTQTPSSLSLPYIGFRRHLNLRALWLMEKTLSSVSLGTQPGNPEKRCASSYRHAYLSEKLHLYLSCGNWRGYFRPLPLFFKNRELTLWKMCKFILLTMLCSNRIWYLCRPKKRDPPAGKDRNSRWNKVNACFKIQAFRPHINP